MELYAGALSDTRCNPAARVSYQRPLAALGPACFSNLINLEWLHLDQNEITTLPGGIYSGQGNSDFSRLSRLQYLDHNDLGLGIMSATFFTGLISLCQLTLRYDEPSRQL